MMISLFQAMVIFAHRPWKVRDPKSKDALGVGAFNLVRRDAYEKIGTYQSMRLSVVDDMRLAEKVKQAGLPSRVAFGEGMVSLRWAVGAGGVVRNLTKNFFAHLRYNVGIRPAGLAGHVVAAPGALAGNRVRHRMGARRLRGGAGFAPRGVCGNGQTHRESASATCSCIRWPAC